MTVTYDDWRKSAADLELCACNFLKNPASDGAKAELRRACNRAAALARLEKAARDLEDTRPGERPIEPGQPEAETPPVNQARLPYSDN